MIDGHIHYAHSLEPERLKRVIKRHKLDGVGLQCIPNGENETNEEALEFKEEAPVPVYVFGGIPRTVYSLDEGEMSKELKKAAEHWMKRGCSGIKMLEGKPNIRKQYSVPDFDRPVWKAYWGYLEAERIPVYFHVNDPEEFWDRQKISRHALESGWLYDDTFVNNEQQYQQVLNVLREFPNLKVVFPHFFFMSRQLERLADILKQYPDVRVDLAPGIELYYNLSEQREAAREFFECFQDRIIYGSDIGAREIVRGKEEPLCMEECDGRTNLIREFLEQEGEYILYPDGFYIQGEPQQMQGLGLPERILDKIYKRNFLELIGGD